MAAQTVTLAGKRFVILAESEYRKLTPKSTGARTAKPKHKRKRQLSKQDLGDLAEHRRRMAEPGEVPLESVRRRLGL